jgi:hypothetical protein
MDPDSKSDVDRMAHGSAESSPVNVGGGRGCSTFSIRLVLPALGCWVSRERAERV